MKKNVLIKGNDGKILLAALDSVLYTQTSKSRKEGLCEVSVFMESGDWFECEIQEDRTKDNMAFLERNGFVPIVDADADLFCVNKNLVQAAVAEPRVRKKALMDREFEITLHFSGSSCNSLTVSVLEDPEPFIEKLREEIGQ